MVFPACPGSILTTPAGQVLWQTTLVTDRYLVGPLAADPSGATYYVDDGFEVGGVVDGGSRIMSLDECGNLRWNKPWSHYYNDSVSTHLVVSGSRLIASNGDVRAFDLATGDELWTADLVTWGNQQGLGDLSGSDSLGAPAVTADGTVYLTAYSMAQTWLLAIDTTGAPSVVAPVPGTTDGGFATDLIVDNAGQLDVSVVFTNVTPGPGAIVSLGRDGGVGWQVPMMSMGYQERLMSGTSFVLAEDSATVLDLGGGVRGSLGGGFAKPAVVDAPGAIYAISAVSSAGMTVGAWNADLSTRWSTVLPGNTFYEYTGGPLLGDGSHLFFLQQLNAGTSITTAVSALDQQTGTQVAWPFAEESPGYMLLTPTGELVFTLGQRAVALSSGGEKSADTLWPTPRGGIDQRGVAKGQ
jgi:hypothetical protein